MGGIEFVPPLDEILDTPLADSCRSAQCRALLSDLWWAVWRGTGCPLHCSDVTDIEMWTKDIHSSTDIAGNSGFRQRHPAAPLWLLQWFRHQMQQTVIGLCWSLAIKAVFCRVMWKLIASEWCASVPKWRELCVFYTSFRSADDAEPTAWRDMCIRAVFWRKKWLLCRRWWRRHCLQWVRWW